eukprot:CAMPEP_0184710662 /NCGR_PEP_ID=MMETSP0314-20130426/1421_1 /TAXON_ID=38298 /ORGANISM="Rhodella maculata, Strain CCMP 736" /LENGTH=53 /DNA_ID=CAMNT_0027172541 /DNA_START=120 /DNA_END=281 /DNA_ORIENTATION=-
MGCMGSKEPEIDAGEDDQKKSIPKGYTRFKMNANGEKEEVKDDGDGAGEAGGN